MSAAYHDWEPDVEFIAGGPQSPPVERVIDLAEASSRTDSKLWPFLGDIALLDTFFSYEAADRRVEIQIKGLSDCGFPNVDGLVIRDEEERQFSGQLVGYYFPRTNRIVEGLLRVGFSPVIQDPMESSYEKLPRQKTRPSIENNGSVRRLSSK
ncbi:MAG: hypothetical protein U5L95_02915 [Candidatus Saccharibacteria bacterium]|nr:hypothetical protein [Candidatus Saccharibacteria bacterium]